MKGSIRKVLNIFQGIKQNSDEINRIYKYFLDIENVVESFESFLRRFKTGLKNNKRLETFRKKQLYKEEWKIITFISENKNLIPEEKECQKLVNSAYAYFNIENRHWVEFLLEERIVKTS